MNTAFSDNDVAAMLKIAGEVGELGQDVRVRRTHILDRLLNLIGGCWAVCSEMDPGHVKDGGWAMPNSILCAGKLTAYQQDIIDRYLTGHLGDVDPCVPYLLRQNKPVVTLRRMDVVDRSWYRSDHFNKVRRPIGFGESLYGILTTPDGRRLKLSLHRELNDSPFEERHVRMLHVFNENLAGLYCAPRMQPAEASSPRLHEGIEGLPPRLRPVMQRLLTGDSEKQAAQQLGLSYHTVHQYVKTIYRLFGTSSRGELLARFVAHAP